MILGIVGYRHYCDYEEFCQYVSTIQNITGIVSGGCRGTDMMAEKYAKEHDIPLTVHCAQWHKFGRRSGPIRNALIVKDSDQILAFLGEDSKGTQDAINKARKSNKPVTVINI